MTSLAVRQREARDRSIDGIWRDEPGGPVRPNWNTKIHAFENIARPGRPQFDISIRLWDE